MDTILPILLSISGIIFYTFFYLYILKHMKKTMQHFTWDSYCKHCGIYHQHSHWTDIKHMIQNIRK